MSRAIRVFVESGRAATKAKEDSVDNPATDPDNDPYR
jgi:hypothetical protein